MEALSILINVLETAFVHVDVGTPQEIYLWPYFARIPLKALTPQQRVELFRIVTGADYKDMVEFGVYSFYRLGIAPDGTWQFFVAVTDTVTAPAGRRCGAGSHRYRPDRTAS